MRIHIVQLDIAWEDKPANHARIRELLSGLTLRRGDFVLLPEMFDTGFSINVETTSDGDGASSGFMRDLAQEHGVYVQGSVTVIKDEKGRAFNRALTFSPEGEEVSSYDKLHPFTFGREHERFDGGDHTSSFTWKAGEEDLRVFTTVCFDLRFPELYRVGASRGAEAFTCIANWPAPRAEHWRTLLRARAIENLAYVFAVNRAGSDPHLPYPGRSAVISPRGEVLAELGGDEAIETVEIDASAAGAWRNEFPVLSDRRSILTRSLADLPTHTHGGTGGV
jgi:predicted amidohydrolase